MRMLRAHGLALAIFLVWPGCGGGGGNGDDDAADAPGEDDGGDGDSDGTGEPDSREDDGVEADPQDDSPDGVDADLDGEADVEPDPLEPFERFCGGRAWEDTLVPGKVGELHGEVVGYYGMFGAGVVEMMEVVPEHPFQVTTIRLAFAAGQSGVARIRLMRMTLRSYPASYPSLDGPGANLIEPVDLTVVRPEAEDWLEIDVSDEDVFLLPTEHYAIVYEHLDEAPYLAVESVAEGDYNRALILDPAEFYPYGTEGNYRMELAGNFFCAWTQEERLFGEDTGQPFAAEPSFRILVPDLDGDRHDDLVLLTSGPVAYFGDGAGGFAAAPFDAFPDEPQANVIAFGDLDNDGDVDAFAGHSLTMDSDGDGVTLADGDCNDTAATVGPSAAETAGNGLDDDCDGTADDGTDTSDADGDGASIADGDCDDTSVDVFPGAPELRDGRDNDCDRLADEDFVDTIQLNDGTGLFSQVPDAGVELIDSSPVASFGDGNGDGLLDLYWGNWRLNAYSEPAAPDRYFAGNGDGTFADALGAAGMAVDPPRATYGLMWTDVNNDGFQDLWVGNYYDPNLLWLNDGTGHFADAAVAMGLHKDRIGGTSGCTFGGDFGDIDNDGDLDHVVANITHVRLLPDADMSMLLVNQGPPDFVFVDESAARGIIAVEGTQNALFGDFDNDMDLDLVVTSTYPTQFSLFFRNDGPEGFTDITYETATAVRSSVGLAWSDVDEDGDLDLFIGSGVGAVRVHLFINRVGQDSNWVELVLEGAGTNHDALGARVTLTAGGVTQLREVKGPGGHASNQTSRVVHFGLGSAASIDGLTVHWVGGDTETVSGAAPNGRYLVVEGSGAATPL